VAPSRHQTAPGLATGSVSGAARRHDLDALRAFAMLLGIALHACLAYTDIPWVVREPTGNPAYFHFFSFVHGFRMPLFFLLSGFFTAMLWYRRGTGGLVKHRSKRIALPLAIGLVTIVPATFAVAIGASIVTNAASSDGPAVRESTSDADLWTAAARGDADRVAYWIENRDEEGVATDLDAQDPRFGITALGWAAMTGEAEVAAQLIDAGADPSARNRDSNTPLHSACFFGRSGVARVLLGAGADPLAQSDSGETPADTMDHDARTVGFIASLTGVQAEFEEVRAGRDEIRPLLEAAIEDARQGGVAEPVAKSGHPAEWIVGALFAFPTFNHLWFLWHLCWLVAGFAVVAVVAGPALRGLSRVSIARLLIGTPASLLWLVPLVAAFEFAMDGGVGLPAPWPTVLGTVEGPVLGPATSAGLAPMVLVLGYNAVFFGFGALLYLVRSAPAEAGSPRAHLGRGWWLMLPLALLAYLPTMVLLYAAEPEVGETVLTNAVQDRSVQLALAGLGQGVFVWGLCFGLIGLGERVLSGERRWVRYVSDSSYWLYVAHLPLVFALHAAFYFVPIPAWSKFALVTIITTALLLASYALFVRYTFIGRLLNGRRERPRRRSMRTPPDVPEGAPGGLGGA
jgi:peptidoglycan/LPS O-acetylase OafA/YrhL